MSDLARVPSAEVGLPLDRLAALTRGGKAYLLLLPSLAFLILFTYFPILQVLWSSLFHKPYGQAQVGFVGLDNYARVLHDEAFQRALVNNLIYALGTVLPSVVIALLLAVLLNRSTRLNAVLRGLLFSPTMIPLVAAAALFSFVFMPRLGLLDYYLAALGLHGANWIGDPDIALYSLMALTVWKNAGYYMLFYLAGLQAIPEEAHEAATLDGASWWQRLRCVTLPYLRPTTSFVAVIALINAITSIDHVIVLTKGGPNNATKLLLYYIYQNAHEFYDPGKATAATVISVAILLGLSMASLKTLERGASHAV
jgi:sn-glycerol 3-phosphate transport system permease protein